MDFKEQAPNTSATQVVTRTWAAEVDATNTFLVVCIKLQDLINMRAGRVNFFGDTKPKLGTLEELTDVYTASWLYNVGDDKPRMRTLVGNFNGGFATYNEAVQMCRDVWRNKERFPIVKASGLILPH